jgi:hypothetical protein
VTVEVILDRGHEGADPAEGGPEGKNGAAYRYLRERGGGGGLRRPVDGDPREGAGGG